MSLTVRRFLAGMITLFLAVGLVYASPAVNLETELQWNSVAPVTASKWSDLQADNSGFDLEYLGEYNEPLLGVTDATGYLLDGGETIDGPGLVMGWGDTPAGDYTAAWQFEYPQDPNVIGQTLTAGMIAPQWAANGVQMNRIAIGLQDAGGFLRTWTWRTALVANPATNTIAWNQLWNVSIGPIAGMIPPAVPGPASATRAGTVVNPLFWSQPAFNPATVMFILGIENGNILNPAAVAPVPPGGFANMPMWNWWQSMVMTPEPGTLSLLAIGSLALLRRRRR